MRVFFLTAFALFAFGGHAQDIMLLSESDSMEVKVTKVGLKVITYKKWSNMDGPEYEIDRNDVILIRYQNGNVDNFEGDEDNSNDFFTTSSRMLPEGENPRNYYPTALGFGIFGPTTYLSFSVEHFVKESISFTGGIGIIGIYSGLRFHANGRKNKKSTIYTGVIINYTQEFQGRGNLTPGIYVPLGLEYISKRGFGIAPELAVLVQADGYVTPYIGFQLKPRFRRFL